MATVLKSTEIAREYIHEAMALDRDTFNAGLTHLELIELAKLIFEIEQSDFKGPGWLNRPPGEL